MDFTLVAHHLEDWVQRSASQTVGFWNVSSSGQCSGDVVTLASALANPSRAAGIEKAVEGPRARSRG